MCARATPPCGAAVDCASGVWQRDCEMHAGGSREGARETRPPHNGRSTPQRPLHPTTAAPPRPSAALRRRQQYGRPGRRRCATVAPINQVLPIVADQVLVCGADVQQAPVGRSATVCVSDDTHTNNNTGSGDMVTRSTQKQETQKHFHATALENRDTGHHRRSGCCKRWRPGTGSCRAASQTTSNLNWRTWPCPNASETPDIRRVSFMSVGKITKTD